MKINSAVRQAAALLIIYTVFIQSVAFASPGYSSAGKHSPLPIENAAAGFTKELKNAVFSVFGKSYQAVFSSSESLNAIADFWRKNFSSDTGVEPNADSNERDENAQNSAAVITDNPGGSLTYAAISRHRPSLNGGTIQGSLRVFSGESYTVNSQFHLNGDLYTVGTPNITVNSGASHGGVINEGGAMSPSGYGITLNSGAVLPGKIRVRANSFALPSDIPASVPNPSGTRYVNINSPSDIGSIGNWATLRSLNVSPSNLVINVPPGNYDTFSMNGSNIKLVFSAGTYNFSGTINLNSGSRVESNGQVTINVGQGLNVNNGSYLLGNNTVSSDVKLNVIGSSMTIDNGGQINALVRAANATVNINNGIVRGYLIADYLNINSGQIIESLNPTDTTLPVVGITSPSNGAIVQDATVNLTGTANDTGNFPSGISGVKVNGITASYDSANGAWSIADFPLTVGNNVITAVATDNAGNQASASINVTRIVNQPPVANAGSDRTIELPNTAILVGSASDDGYPIGSTLSYSWSKIAGDGNVSFTNPNNLQTNASFSTSGVYLLRLSVTDGQYTANDDVQITVYPENQAPAVNAGTDQTVYLPNNAALSGTATDDGYPLGSSLTVNWSKVSGDGDVIFADPASAATNASFSTAGTYVLRLTASDGTLTSADELTIVVVQPNEAPVVNAGADMSAAVSVPVNLNGTATDDGLPAGNNPVVSWNKVSGPGNVAFTNADLAATAATFDAPGTYTLRLSADDGELSASDEIIVTVNQRPAALFTVPGIARNTAIWENSVSSYFRGSDILDFSSQSSASLIPYNIIDDNYNTRWASATGQIANQFVTISFPHGETKRFDRIRLQNAASLEAVRDFSVQVSTTTTDAEAWTTVLSDTALQNSRIQEFILNAPVQAKFVRLLLNNNYGSTNNITIYGFETVDSNEAGIPSYFEYPSNPAQASENGSIFSSSSDSGVSLTAANAIDGLTGSYWQTATAQINNQNFIVRLSRGKSYPVDRVRIVNSGGTQGVQQFKIEVSDTNTGNESFTEVLSGTLQRSSSFQEFVFPNGAVNAKYFRFTAINNHGNTSNTRLHEFQAITVPSSLTSFSGYYSQDLRPENLLDDNSNTSWMTAQGAVTNQWVKIKLPHDDGELIESVSIQPYSSTAAETIRDFEVFVSSTTDEDSAFVPVIGGTVLNSGSKQTFVLPGGAVRARYVKFLAKNNYGSPNYIRVGTFAVTTASNEGNIISNVSTSVVSKLTSPVMLVNGASIIASSGSYGTSASYMPGNILDYAAGNYWLTNGIQNQFLKIKLAGENSHPIRGIKIGRTDAIGNDSIKDFEIWISNTTADDAAFSRAFEGTVLNNRTLQSFYFSGGAVSAKYVKLIPKNNYGYSLYIATTDFDVISDNAGSVIDSSSQASQSYRPEYAFDSNISTAWRTQANSTMNQSIKLALPGNQPTKIYAVTLEPDSPYSPKDFEVKVSTTTGEENAFTTVYTGTAAQSNESQTFVFNDLTDAKYVKIIFNNGYRTDYIALREIGILSVPSNSATLLGYSNRLNATYSPENALDFDTLSGSWRTANGQNTNQSLKLALPAAESWVIDHIAIQPTTSTTESPRHFELQTSNTNYSDSSFQTVLKETLRNDGTVQHFFFEPVKARHVRLLIKDNYGAATLSLNAFWVFSPQIGTFRSRFLNRSTSTGSNLNYLWEFGDGATSSERDPLHLYSNPGLYNVRLTATDGNSLSSTYTLPYLVQGSAAIDFSWTPVPVKEGQGATFTDISARNNEIREWTWGDNTAMSTVSQTQTSHTFTDNGSYSVVMRAADDRGIYIQKIKPVEVINQPPTVNAGGDTNIFVGQSWTPSTSVSDPGAVDRNSLVCNWDFGDGQTSGAIANCTSSNSRIPHTYSSAGSYTATLSVTDKDGAAASDAVVINVNKTPTIINYTGDEAVEPGQNLILRAKLIETQNFQPLSGKTVEFSFEGNTYTAVTNSQGIAETSVGFNGSEQSQITARFNGDANYLPSSTGTCGFQRQPIDAIVVIDESGSMGGQPLQDAKNGANIFLDSLRLNQDLAGVVSFSDSGVLRHQLSNNITSLKAAVNAIAVGGGTNIGTGIEKARIELTGTRRNPYAYPVMLVLSDGASSDDPVAAAQIAKNAGIRVISIGLGSVNEQQMRGIASSPSDYYYTPNSSSLAAIYATIMGTLCRPANKAPVVNAGENRTIVLPENSISLSGTATDDGLPSNTLTVNWSKQEGPNGVSFGNANSLNTVVSFTNPGEYILRLSATDGQYTTSSDVTVRVYPPNSAPQVSAGQDQAITLPGSANLNAVVTDDGLPLGSGVSVVWSKISGPGIVNFAAPNSNATAASFSQPGTYLLRLTATDSQLASFDELVVTVSGQTIYNQPPIVNAGEDKVVVLPNKSVQFVQNNLNLFNQLASNPSIGIDFDSIAAGTDITGQTLNGILFEKGEQPSPSAPLMVVRAADTYTPGGFSGVIDAETNKLFPASGENVLSPGGIELAPGTDNLKENDDLKMTFTEPVAAFGFDILFQEYDFYSAVAITILDSEGNILYQNPNLPVSTGGGGGAPGGREFFGFVSARSNIKTIVVDEFDGNAEFPDSNIGFSSFRVQKVLPNTIVSLNGSVSDDGLPEGGTLTSAWSKISGAGTVTFSHTNSPTSAVTFSEAGTYVLRLTANDGALESTDEVTVVAYNNDQQPENQPPTVNAGQDQTITLPNQANLFGIVNDDGMPSGSSVQASWSKVSGSGDVVFTSADSASTNASFSQAGTYVLRLTATDSDKTTVDDISITVLDSSATNQPPQVSAGNDVSVNLNSPVTLNGSASDDGLPTGSTLSLNWSKINGPGTVAFSNPSALQTSATFGAEGVYTLRLTATDGELSASDDVIVTVNPAQSNQPPTVDAGTDKTIKLNGNLAVNGSAEIEPVGGAIPDWNVVSGSSWSRLQGGSGTTPFARFGEYVFSPGTAANAEITQDIDVRAYANKIDAGTQSFTVQVYLRSLAETTPDSGRILIEYRDRSNLNSIATLNTGEISSTSDWHLTEDVRVPPAGTGFIRVHLIAVRKSGLSNDVFFDGVSFKADGGGAAIKLDGTATDDNLPTGNNLQTTWSKVSGSGNVVFGNANSAASPAFFETAGTYVLRLTATDGEFTSNDEVTVTVSEANQPPVANAGADAAVNAGANLTLNGSATDDGGNLRYRWGRVSGPGNVSINNGRIANPTVSFSAAGTYVLRLFVEDGEFEASDDVTITVNAAPQNQPPTVDAGQNQSISLPNNTATLNGTATDDNLPNGSPIITWSKTSGSGNVVFANPNSAQTTATFGAVGTYILRLTISDGQYTAYDEMSVTVNPENLPPTVNAGADQTVIVSQNSVLQGEASDDGLPAGGSFSASWTKVSGDGNVNFSNPNQTGTYATFSQTGTYVLRLTVSDSQLSTSDDVTVTVIPDQPAPTVEILTPNDGVSITEPTTISGTVSDGNWKLEYSLTDTDNLNNRVWTTVSNGTGAASGNLGTLDTTLMLNGLYDVRLMTTNQVGQTSADIISVAVENNLKVGHFTVSFEDMNVPMAGIPIQVIRTYDSRDKRKGDFGYGWTLGLKNVRVEKNKVLGLSWYQTRSSTFIPNYCIEPTRPHIVTVTMPDGEVEKFEAKTERQCQQAAPITETRLIFTPQAGTRGKLSVAGDNTVYVAGSVPGEVQLIAYDGTGIFDRTQFKYTAKDGTEFVVNQGAGGLQSVRDPNGNTLTISASGITHSSGQSIAFTRDTQGRITQITDPEGVSNVYTYSGDGDLISYKDRENNTTSFTYESTIPHHLKSIVDPLNRTPIRNEYDASGRLLKHIDANGDEIVYTHNLAARSETVTDRLGNATVYEYDVRGNVLVKRDALNNQTTYSYDANDNMLTETNAFGKVTTYTYDQFDNRTSVTDALGNRTEMTYNAKGQVLTIKDARNNTVATNTYDTGGNLLTTTDANGNVTTNTYSAYTGQLTTTKDALNNVTTFEYFGSYVKKEIDAQGNETSFTYDQNGNRSSQTVKRTNAQGQIETITTNFEYDNLNRLTKNTSADGSFTQTEYNELGQQKASIDQAGNRTESEYDSLGRLIKTTYPDGRFEESTFDDEGRRLTGKDRAGRITNYEYDALGRLKKTTYADGTFTTTNYDALGQVASSVDARGNSTVYTYDAAGRRLTVKNALDQITSFAYDANGNQTSMTDAANHTTAFVYDSLNRKTRTNFADSSFTETTFDALGRRIAEKDHAGKLTQFVYDSLGRLTKVKDALDQETRYEYNETGQQIKQIDALNRVTNYEYDRLGRRTKRVLPMGQTEIYSYSPQGNLQSRTDFNGKTTTFSYDNMRRLLSKTPDASLNQPAVSFTYNALGQRATMTDASGTTVYAYDNRNRLAGKQTPFGTLSYTYDGAGNIKTLRSSNANGVSVDYSYDELNRLQTAKDNRLVGNQTTTYSYDAVGNLQSYSYPNQITTAYAYNNLNRLTTMTIANASNNLASYRYTLGASGNRTQVVEGSGRTVNYVYDDLYRLTQETIANSSNNGQIAYNYDAVGNRLQRTSSVGQVQSQSSVFDANDRLNSDSYDDNGNTKISNGRQFSYDFENKLTSTSDGITIVYDGDGNRVSKTAGGVTTNYLVDTNNLTGYAQVIEELQGGNVTKQFTYGLDLISQRQSSGVSFYNYDGHGSVRNLTNSAAQITDSYDYDAFGNLINRTGVTDNSYLYAGEQFDADLGFYYNRARYLNVETGRFISQDTYEGNRFEPKSLHKYAYAENDGTNNIDPSGNMSIGEVGIVLGAIAVISAMAIGIYYIRNLKLPVRASWVWKNSWRSIDGKKSLNDDEINIIKQTAYATFKKAFSGYTVDSVEGEGGNRKIVISDELGSGVGATYPTTYLSTVYFPNVKATLGAVVTSNNINKNSTEMLEALGRGLGATAAHELGHQFGLEFSTHPKSQGFYDTEALNETSVDHFFGELRWSPFAMEKMNNVLPKAE